MAVNSGGYKRKVRNSFRRVRRPIIFLVAEGKNKTETLYFRDFGQDVNRIIKFAPGNHTDPVNMVNELKSYIAENDFSQDLGDKAYCLIDADVNPAKNEQIAKAEELAKRAGIEIVLSVPCFEIWFLSHFNFSTKQYTSSAEVVAELQKYIPGYRKSTSGVYEKTKTLISTAHDDRAGALLYNEKNRKGRGHETQKQKDPAPAAVRPGGRFGGLCVLFLFWLHQGLRHYGQSLAFHAVYGGAGPVYRLCQ